MARMTLDRYPVETQTFSELRRDHLLYVDKSAYVWRLAHQGGKYFFLSRPRRFGKSLLISTMQSYFEGRRELFCGLLADELEDAWESYPVIRLDMSSIKPSSVEDLRAQLGDLLRAVEQEVTG